MRIAWRATRAFAKQGERLAGMVEHINKHHNSKLPSAYGMDSPSNVCIGITASSRWKTSIPE
jgi:hypothetical protein